MHGQEIFGDERFAIRRWLGEGGFGVVYEAWDQELEQPVALKVLRATHNTSLLRFKQEFRSLADVSHPNLVRLGELVSKHDDWFFTMELVEGRDILSHVWREGEGGRTMAAARDTGGSSQSATLEAPVTPAVPGMVPVPGSASGVTMPFPPRVGGFDLDRVRDVFGQLADGVNALHDFGLLHRDLKPSNVMVSVGGRVVVLDFGLVAHLERGDVAESLQIVGTPAYMSPEQSVARDVTPASDWYSVGVILWEALTGVPLFRGTLQEIIMCRKSASPPRPSEVVEGVPADLDELCWQLIQIDPSVRPSGDEVSRRLNRTAAVPIVAPTRHAPDRFVGRHDQLRVLEQAFQAASDGNAATVFISGTSGMGKTALVRCFLDRVRAVDTSALVLSGRCYQRESVPYKALDHLVDELSRHLGRMQAIEAARFMPRDKFALGRLFPVLAGVGETTSGRTRPVEIPDAMELRRRAFGALRELLGRLSDEFSVVLFVDDLQWGDVDSAALLREIVRPPDPPPLLLIGCYRKEDAARSPLLRLLAEESDPELLRWDIELGELPSDEARELALAVIGSADAEARSRAELIARESGGSPFFVDELARHRPAADGGTEPIRLESVLEARVSSLPEEARNLLEVVAVAGEPLDLAVANKVANLAANDRSAMDLLGAGHWVRPCAMEGRTAFETFHDRVRQTVVSLVPGDRLPRCHERLARTWEESGTASSATLAEHYLAAGESADAARHALVAARQADDELAFDRAARLYQLCLDIGTYDAAETLDLTTRMADALGNAGRGGDAGSAYLEAAELAGVDQELELRRRAAEQYLISGHIDEGREVLSSVVSMAGLTMPPTPLRALLGLLGQRLRIVFRGMRFTARDAGDIPADDLTKIDVCWSAAIGLGMVELIRGAYFQTLNLSLAMKAGEPGRVGRALAMETGFSGTGGGRTRKRTDSLRKRCRAIVDDLDDPYLTALYDVNEGIATSLEGRYPESLEVCRRGEALLREKCTGVTWELDTAQLYHNHALVNMGRWKDLGERVPAMLEEARDRGDLYITTYLRSRNSYLLHLAADDVERARAEQERSLEGWSQQGFQVQHYWDLFARGEIDLYAGEPHAAWERLEHTWQAFTRSLLPRAQALFLEAVFLRARTAVALAADIGGTEAESLLKRASKDARTLDREATPWGRAMALKARAGIASVRGDLEDARRHASSAGQAFDEIHMPHYAWAACWRLGQLADGENREQLISRASGWMLEQGVRAPERMVGLLAPGCWD